MFKEKSISRFDNLFILITALIVWYSYAVLVGPVNIKNNKYVDIVSLTISSSAVLYVISFLSKKIKGVLASFLSAIGKDSFYIMGLHIIAYKPCTLLLNVLGYDLNIAQTQALSPDIFTFFIYTIGGVVLPLVFIYSIRVISRVPKSLINGIDKKI